MADKDFKVKNGVIVNTTITLAGSGSGSTVLQAASSASGTLTLPAATDTLVGQATSDTLTNKTLTSPSIGGATLTGTLTANSSAGSSGQFLQSTGNGVQWAYSGFITSAVSSNITLASNYNYFVDTSVARTLTLPSSPAQGNEIHIFDSTSTAGTNNITVNSNGAKINGSVQNLVIDQNDAGVTLIYVGSTYGWKVI
jgi:hypothetical protein